MATAKLDWTEAFTNVNQISEYQVFKSTNVVPTDAGFLTSFSLLSTLPVTRDEFGEITGPDLTLTDPAVDFDLNFYHYYVLAVPVRVGEASSPQTAPSRSNIIALATPPGIVVLSGASNVPAGTITLTWTASTVGSAALDRYCVFRSLNGAPFVLFAEIDAADPRTFIDTGIDRDLNTYTYYVVAYDLLGIVSAPSNFEAFAVLGGVFLISNEFPSGVEASVAISATGIDSWVETSLVRTGSNAYRGFTYSPDIQRIWVVGRDQVGYSDDGETWTHVALAVGWADMGDVAYSPTLDIVVACGDTNLRECVWSDDRGDTWNAATMPASMLNGVVESVLWVPWANSGSGAFMAVIGVAASPGPMVYSTDGKNWTHMTLAVAISPEGIADGGDRMVCMNRGNTDYYATTGADPILPGSWTYHGLGTAIVASQHVRAREIPNRVFIHANNQIMRSLDGTSWATVSTTITSGLIYGAYSPPLDRFVIMKTSGTPQGQYSDDGGTTWPTIAPSFPLGAYRDMGAGVIPNGRPDPPVLSGTFDIVESEMLLTWTEPAALKPLQTYFVFRSDDGGPFFLADTVDASATRESLQLGVSTTAPATFYVRAQDNVGAISNPSNVFGIQEQFLALEVNQVFRSFDGDTWTEHVIANQTWRGCAYSPELNRYVAVSSSGTNRAATSDDGGLTWTTRVTPGAVKQWYAVEWIPHLSLFIAVANNGSTQAIMTSPEGINWSILTEVGSNTYAAVDYIRPAGLVVIGGATAGTFGKVSSDGITFRGPLTAMNANRTIGFAWSTLDSVMYSWGSTGEIWKSSDGDTWAFAGGDAGGPGAGISGLTYSNDLDVLVGAENTGNTIVSSTDKGVTLVVRASAVAVNDVARSDKIGLFIAVADSGFYYTSVDGVTWSSAISFPVAASSVNTIITGLFVG